MTNTDNISAAMSALVGAVDAKSPADATASIDAWLDERDGDCQPLNKVISRAVTTALADAASSAIGNVIITLSWPDGTTVRFDFPEGRKPSAALEKTVMRAVKRVLKVEP